MRLRIFSAGFAGAFIDREVESRGVRREDLAAITSNSHAHSSITSTKRKLSMKV